MRPPLDESRRAEESAETRRCVGSSPAMVRVRAHIIFIHRHHRIALHSFLCISTNGSISMRAHPRHCRGRLRASGAIPARRPTTHVSSPMRAHPRGASTLKQECTCIRMHFLSFKCASIALRCMHRRCRHPFDRIPRRDRRSPFDFTVRRAHPSRRSHHTTIIDVHHKCAHTN
jgi:hypothetical protein